MPAEQSSTLAEGLPLDGMVKVAVVAVEGEVERMFAVAFLAGEKTVTCGGEETNSESAGVGVV